MDICFEFELPRLVEPQIWWLIYNLKKLELFFEPYVRIILKILGDFGRFFWKDENLKDSFEKVSKTKNEAYK